MTGSTPRARHPRQQRLMLTEPKTGWSREDYDRELAAYIAQRGRAPQTATMHTETAAALGLREPCVMPAAGDQPLLVTSAEYPPQTITLYY